MATHVGKSTDQTKSVSGTNQPIIFKQEPKPSLGTRLKHGFAQTVIDQKAIREATHSLVNRDVQEVLPKDLLDFHQALKKLIHFFPKGVNKALTLTGSKEELIPALDDFCKQWKNIQKIVNSLQESEEVGGPEFIEEIGGILKNLNAQESKIEELVSELKKGEAQGTCSFFSWMSVDTDSLLVHEIPSGTADENNFTFHLIDKAYEKTHLFIEKNMGLTQLAKEKIIPEILPPLVDQAVRTGIHSSVDQIVKELGKFGVNLKPEKGGKDGDSTSSSQASPAETSSPEVPPHDGSSPTNADNGGGGSSLFSNFFKPGSSPLSDILGAVKKEVQSASENFACKQVASLLSLFLGYVATDTCASEPLRQLLDGLQKELNAENMDRATLQTILTKASDLFLKNQIFIDGNAIPFSGSKQSLDNPGLMLENQIKIDNALKLNKEKNTPPQNQKELFQKESNSLKNNVANLLPMLVCWRLCSKKVPNERFFANLLAEGSKPAGNKAIRTAFFRELDKLRKEKKLGFLKGISIKIAFIIFSNAFHFLIPLVIETVITEMLSYLEQQKKVGYFHAKNTAVSLLENALAGVASSYDFKNLTSTQSLSQARNHFFETNSNLFIDKKKHKGKTGAQVQVEAGERLLRKVFDKYNIAQVVYDILQKFKLRPSQGRLAFLAFPITFTYNTVLSIFQYFLYGTFYLPSSIITKILMKISRRLIKKYNPIGTALNDVVRVESAEARQLRYGIKILANNLLDDVIHQIDAKKSKEESKSTEPEETFFSNSHNTSATDPDIKEKLRNILYYLLKIANSSSFKTVDELKDAAKHPSLLQKFDQMLMTKIADDAQEPLAQSLDKTIRILANEDLIEKNLGKCIQQLNEMMLSGELISDHQIKIIDDAISKKVTVLGAKLANVITKEVVGKGNELLNKKKKNYIEHIKTTTTALEKKLKEVPVELLFNSSATLFENFEKNISTELTEPDSRKELFKEVRSLLQELERQTESLLSTLRTFTDTHSPQVEELKSLPTALQKIHQESIADPVTQLTDLGVDLTKRKRQLEILINDEIPTLLHARQTLRRSLSSPPANTPLHLQALGAPPELKSTELWDWLDAKNTELNGLIQTFQMVPEESDRSKTLIQTCLEAGHALKETEKLLARSEIERIIREISNAKKIENTHKQELKKWLKRLKSISSLDENLPIKNCIEVAKKSNSKQEFVNAFSMFKGTNEALSNQSEKTATCLLSTCKQVETSIEALLKDLREQRTTIQDDCKKILEQGKTLAEKAASIQEPTFLTATLTCKSTSDEEPSALGKIIETFIRYQIQKKGLQMIKVSENPATLQFLVNKLVLQPFSQGQFHIPYDHYA